MHASRLPVELLETKPGGHAISESAETRRWVRLNYETRLWDGEKEMGW